MLFEKTHQPPDIGILHRLHCFFVVRLAVQRCHEWSIPFRIELFVSLGSWAWILKDKSAPFTHLVGTCEPIAIGVRDGPKYLPAAEIAGETVFMVKRGGIEPQLG
jgi:hypothetical protein